MITKDKVFIFSSGSQYGDWVASNCERCTKYDPYAPGDCEIEEALLEAYVDDGSVTPEIATRAGCTPENALSYVWPCAEVEWTEEWKAEFLAQKEEQL